MYQKISKLLISNNVWVFISIIITFVFLWVMTFVNVYSNWIYLSERKWRLFGSTMIYMLMIFSPMLIFSLFRKILRSEKQSIFNYVAWILVFLIFPTSLGFISLDFMPISVSNEIIVLLGFSLTIAEIFTNPISDIKIKTDWKKFYDKISIEWLPIGISILLSIYMAYNLKTFNLAKQSYANVILCSTLLMSIYYLFYRVNNYFLVDKIYREKGVVYYGFSFLAMIILFALPVILTITYLPGLSTLVDIKLGEKWVGDNPPTYFYAMHLASIISPMILTIPLTIFVQWISQSRKIQSLQKEKSETELSLLKQQINPHFFFNTLNNVYALSLEQNQKAPEAILQLSDLMRFVIYEGSNDYVPLKNEVAYLQDYMELQKMRLHTGHDIHLDLDIENPEIDIAPLLFIILLENAFKHGIENSEEDGLIIASLIESDGVVTFNCRNSSEPSNKDKGLGLSNLKKRLDLIYPDKYKLEIIDDTSYFTVQLQIDTRKTV